LKEAMKSKTIFACILHFLPLLVVFCAPGGEIDNDAHTCKASSPISYPVKQAVPTTADSSYKAADFGTLQREDSGGLTEWTVDITIKRYNRDDDVDTSMIEDDEVDNFWTLDLQARKEIPISGPLYVALHTQINRQIVIGYIDCADNGGKLSRVIRGGWDAARLSQSMELSRVWIHSNWRGKGVGGAMLGFALRDIAAYTPSTHAMLVARAENAIRFYGKAGFVPIGRRYASDKCMMGIELRKPPLY